MSNALDAIPRELRGEHASRVAEAHRMTAARCRALGYERVALLFERMAAACGEPARLERACAALEGPAMRVIPGGRSGERAGDRLLGRIDDREPA